jgi:hypothetical protein
MPTSFYLTREVELAVQEEATYGTSPGAVAATDMFKHTSRLHITPRRARYYRDQDADYQQASVLAPAQKGRESSDLKIDVDAVPSGAATPTEPDIDVLLKVHFGTKHKATAHTTTTAGSSGTSLVLTAGGGAASGVAIGDLIAVDVSAAAGYEVRRVTNVATDTVTVDRAFTTDPATGRTVKLGTTYRFLNTATLSAYVNQWIAATGVRHAVPGVIISDMEASCAFDNETPMPKFSFSGRGMKEITHATARPTPTTAGQPLVASQAKAWIGAVKVCPVNASFKSNNGLELRENLCSGLEPAGVKRTGNNSRYSVETTLESLLTTGDTDTAAIYELAKASDVTPLDIIVQWGIVPGTMVAYCTPRFVCDPERIEITGEFGVRFSGKALGIAGDDELFLAFI